MAITPLPTLDRTSATFRTDVDTFFGSQLPAFASEANALQADVNAKQVTASAAAVTATTKAGEALASANNASTSEANANTYKNDALAAQAASEAALDSFDDRYLGAKAVAPTLDNDGNALQIGALYWDTVLPGMRAWTGAAWSTLPAATAAATANTPAGGITETNVQGALNGLDAALLPISGKWLTYGGTANALAMTSPASRPLLAYIDGGQYRFKATSANTAAATLSIDGLVAKPILTITGAALPAGYLRTDAETVVRYDTALGSFVADRKPERGSNANGEYVRYADGTQICTRVVAAASTPITTAYGSIYRSAPITKTFPAAFSSVPSASGGTPTPGGGIPSFEQSDTTSSTVTYYITHPNSQTLTLGESYTAVGRWF